MLPDPLPLHVHHPHQRRFLYSPTVNEVGGRVGGGGGVVSVSRHRILQIPPEELGPDPLSSVHSTISIAS